MPKTKVRGHVRAGRPVRPHYRGASIQETDRSVVITVDKQDWEKGVKEARKLVHNPIVGKVARAELKKLGVVGL